MHTRCVARTMQTPSKGGANRHHVPGEVEPSKTACPLRLVIAALVAVTLPIDIKARDTFFCSRCVKARPTLFPASAVASVGPERAAITAPLPAPASGSQTARSRLKVS